MELRLNNVLTDLKTVKNQLTELETELYRFDEQFYSFIESLTELDYQANKTVIFNLYKKIRFFCYTITNTKNKV